MADALDPELLLLLLVPPLLLLLLAASAIHVRPTPLATTLVSVRNCTSTQPNGGDHTVTDRPAVTFAARLPLAPNTAGSLSDEPLRTTNTSCTLSVTKRVKFSLHNRSHSAPPNHAIAHQAAQRRRRRRRRT